MIYLDLFLGFLKVGCFAFGGAYGAIPLIRDVVMSYGWLSDEMLTYMIAVSESAPGPIMVNLATYIGSSQAGFVGSVIATLAVVLPSFLIIYAISLFFDAFLSLTYAQYAFKGIQVCVIYLILSAGLKMLKQIKKNIFNVTIVSLTVVCMVTLSVLAVRFSTVFYILISGTVGVIVYLLNKLRGGEGT